MSSGRWGGGRGRRDSFPPLREWALRVRWSPAANGLMNTGLRGRAIPFPHPTAPSSSRRHLTLSGRERVVHEHRDGHRPNAAGYGSNRVSARHDRVEVDVADELPGVEPVGADVD